MIYWRGDFLNNRIKNLRLETCMSQQKLSDKLNISRSLLSGYESGALPVNIRTQKDICDEFKINIEWLQTGNGEKYINVDGENELEMLMRMFNPNDDKFKTKIITAMMKLDDDGWEAIEFLIDKMTK